MNSKKYFQNIKTAVIGTGSMGKNHARIYNETSNLIFVSDLDEYQGQKIAKDFGVQYYKDFRDGLNQIDALSVAVPTENHEEVVRTVTKQGIHVLVEKPLSNNIVDAESILLCCESNDLILSVGHIERYNPVIQKAKDCLMSGIWGDILGITTRRFSPFPERIKDVGVLYDLAIHDVDLTRFLFGDEVNRVYAWGSKINNTNMHDTANVVLEFKNGKRGFCQTSWRYHDKVRSVDISTTTHNISLDLKEQKISAINLGKFENTTLPEQNPLIEDIEILKSEPLHNEIVDFLSSVVDSHPPLVTGKDGLEAVRIISAAKKSISERRFIDL